MPAGTVPLRRASQLPARWAIAGGVTPVWCELLPAQDLDVYLGARACARSTDAYQVLPTASGWNAEHRA